MITYKNIDWEIAVLTQKLPLKILDKFVNIIPWKYASATQKLTPSFIRKHHKKLEWHYISCKQKLTPSLMRQFKHKIVWPLAIQFQDVPLDLIEELNLFDDALKYQKLPSDFIAKHINKLNNTNIHYLLHNKKIKLSSAVALLLISKFKSLTAKIMSKIDKTN